MKNGLSIAVTGVGGGVGQSILKSLYNSPYKVIGLDGESLGTGLFATQKSYKIPYAHHPDFIPTLLEICKTEQCKLLFPGLDAELPYLSSQKEKFAEIGTTVIVSGNDVIEIADNKLKTFQFLQMHGLPVPRTYEHNQLHTIFADNLFPLIIKPKIGGARSKHVYLAKNKDEMNALIQTLHFVAADFVYQEYIEGDEYTCGSINLNNECKGVIVMKRTLRDGDTYKCESKHVPVIEETIRQLMSVLKPFGACNVQLKLNNNIPYIFEINARCSGTTAARTLCGFNEPLMITDYLLTQKEPQFSIKQQTVLRYWNELIVDNEKIALLNRDGHLESTETLW